MADTVFDNVPPAPPGGGAERQLWREALHSRLADRATPVVQFADSIRSAASLWAGMREWTRLFRAAGVVAGDVVIASRLRDEAIVQVLLSGLWDGISVVLTADSVDAPAPDIVEHHDASLVIANGAAHRADLHWRVRAGAGGWPVDDRVPRARSRRRRTGEGMAVPFVEGVDQRRLTHAAMFEHVRTHPLETALRDTVVAVGLPWDRVAYMLAGLLLPLLVSDELFVVQTLEIPGIRSIVAREPITQLLLTPDSAVAYARGGAVASGMIIHSISDVR